MTAGLVRKRSISRSSRPAPPAALYHGAGEEAIGAFGPIALRPAIEERVGASTSCIPEHYSGSRISSRAVVT
jgi:hypothetical protein